MYSLASYISGGAIFMVAIDLLSPSSRTSLERILRNDPAPASFSQRFAAVAPRPDIAAQILDRSAKGSRLAAPRSADGPVSAVASLKTLGGRSPAIVYLDASGRTVFRSDPATDSTVIAKNQSINQSIRGARETPASLQVDRPVAPPLQGQADRPRAGTPDAPALPAKTPPGCDPAYSPLSRNAPAAFTGRCVVENTAAPLRVAFGQ
jgi:hypothetical protein